MNAVTSRKEELQKCARFFVFVQCFLGSKLVLGGVSVIFVTEFVRGKV